MPPRLIGPELKYAILVLGDCYEDKESSAPCKIYAAAILSIISERRLRLKSASLVNSRSIAEVDKRSSQNVIPISNLFGHRY